MHLHTKYYAMLPYSLSKFTEMEVEKMLNESYKISELEKN